MPFPVTPDEVKQIIPPASASWCTKLLALPMRLAFLALEAVTFMVKPDGSITDEFKEWIGVASEGPVSKPFELEATQATQVTIGLRWKYSAVASSFQIFKSKDQTIPTSFFATTNVLTYDDASDDAKSGELWNYWVRAVTAAGVSDPSNVATGVSSNTPSGGGGTNDKQRTFNGPSLTTMPPLDIAGNYTITAVGGGAGGMNGYAYGGPEFKYAGSGGGGGGWVQATYALLVGDVLEITAGAGGPTHSVSGGGQSIVSLKRGAAAPIILVRADNGDAPKALAGGAGGTDNTLAGAQSGTSTQGGPGGLGGLGSSNGGSGGSPGGSVPGSADASAGKGGAGGHADGVAGDTTEPGHAGCVHIAW